ncbi:receptor-interacting serine/threonine-protein kinase 3-like isoform X2 [Clinocottus analis]
MELRSHKPEPVGDASLEKWESLGQGGFGYVYKARHKDLCIDVAIKILRDGISHLLSLQDEAFYMDIAPCDFVVRVYGTYQGCPPGLRSTQQGLVMAFMERGSVESLQKKLSGPPPWPLVCRWAHQVAQGMNFLHSRNIVHHDLKPSNVLLDGDLNAKLADFGLSRVSTSVLNSNRETTDGIEGSYKYMPPEAFEVSYEANRSFDIYSYGILLWSIITGKEPYPSASFALVEIQIPKGVRPTFESIDQMSEEGLKELVELMKKCWDGTPSERPPFKNCLEVTENVFLKYKMAILDVVGQVLTKLSPTSYQSNTPWTRNVSQQPPEQSIDTVDTITERAPIRESVRITTKAKAKFVDDERPSLIQCVAEVMAITEELRDMVSHETYSKITVAGTNQDKVRVLYLTALHSGGEVVKAAFYDALKKHEPRLVERLGG